MLLPSQIMYWSNILNLIIQRYLNETTICIIWSDEFDLHLQQRNNMAAYSTVINIQPNTLSDDLATDIYDHKRKHSQLRSNGVDVTDELVAKLIASIESSHCEKEIPHFVEAFSRASLCSIWRSIRNKFIFVYVPSLEPDWQYKYFQHRFFENQPNILLIEGVDGLYSTQFQLKTNKYVGSRYEKPNSLIYVGTYDALLNLLILKWNLFEDKTYNLQGREVIISCFEYLPNLAIIYNSSNPNARDLATGAEVHIDGTEMRIMLEFCSKYNCTLFIDTTEDDWGTIYPNLTGDGAIGLVLDGISDLSFCAMYMWQSAYVYLDVSVYSGRSGITCVVPAPQLLTSWLLPLQPFQMMLWIAVLLCLGLETICLLFLQHWQNVCVIRDDVDKNITWLHSFRYGFSTTFRLLISQSSNQKYSVSSALRVLLFACFIIDIVVTSVYGGGLASILTVPSFEEAADSVSRLRKFHLKWTASSIAWVSALYGTNDTQINELLSNFHVYDGAELRELAKTAYMGFTVERLLFGHYAVEEHLSREVLPHFKIMIDDIYFQYTVSFVQRLWPLLEHYNQLINTWHASGLDKYWEWRSVADYLDPHVQKLVEASLYYTHQDSSSGPVPLGMANFAGILLIWALGIVLAALVFGTELLYQHFQINE